MCLSKCFTLRQYSCHPRRRDDRFIQICFLSGIHWCQKNCCADLCQGVRGQDAHHPASPHSCRLLKKRNLIKKKWCDVMLCNVNISHHFDPVLRALTPHVSIRSSSVFHWRHHFLLLASCTKNRLDNQEWDTLLQRRMYSWKYWRSIQLEKECQSLL